VQFLRKLEKKRHWDDQEWLLEKTAPSDTLNDLSSNDNSLSFYFFESEDYVDRILSALALSRDYITTIDYYIGDIDIFESARISIDDTPGTTPDRFVNELHRDAVRLDTAKLSVLAVKMFEIRCVERINPKPLEKIIAETIKNGNVDLGSINPNMLEKLKGKNLIEP
tara:strand:- start:987 stop:1487 length:501 start_codon:yes stop_codon:yes gene_type:complete